MPDTCSDSHCCSNRLRQCEQGDSRSAAVTPQGFPQHRDIVTGLAFRDGTHELYSGSFDRTVKIWSLDDRAYVDTLYGHQSEVGTLQCMWLPCMATRAR